MADQLLLLRVTFNMTPGGSAGQVRRRCSWCRRSGDYGDSWPSMQSLCGDKLSVLSPDSLTRRSPVAHEQISDDAAF